MITQLNFAENNRIVLFGFGYTLIVVGLISLEDFRVIIGGNPFFQLVGGASYALYLIHFPLISIMLKIAMGLGLKELGMAGAVISFIVIFISCIVASILFHLYIEIPMMRKLAQYKFKRPIVESSI